jgi:AcrR family transcriptional regulator
MNVQSKYGTSGENPRQAEGRRELLLDAALELFASQGFDATSIKQIAERAGVAAGLLYHYFPGKNAIITEVMKRHGFLPELRSLLLVSEDAPAAQVLEGVALGFSAMVARNQSLFRFIVGASQTHPEVGAGLKAIVSEGVAALASYLDSRILAGELRPHDTTLTARTVLSAVLTTHIVGLETPAWNDLVANILNGILRKPNAN